MLSCYVVATNEVLNNFIKIIIFERFIIKEEKLMVITSESVVPTSSKDLSLGQSRNDDCVSNHVSLST